MREQAPSDRGNQVLSRATPAADDLLVVPCTPTYPGLLPSYAAMTAAPPRAAPPAPVIINQRSRNNKVGDMIGAARADLLYFQLIRLAFDPIG